MIRRIINPSIKSSFFVFGARGTGKTTWLKAYFENIPHLWINLLDDEDETELALNPGHLKAKVNGLASSVHWVVIDEIQKNPKLLDVVHGLIEDTKINFALTGSSARKLKRGSANLLAGRAFVYNMHPLTWDELGDVASLADVLRWGSLPRLLSLPDTADKASFLRAYAKTYLAEEIVAEQLVRNLLPFRRFLPVAAQQNGSPINYAKLSRDTGVDDKTLESYYEILEDTHMGFRLYPYHTSFRKRLAQRPKYYFFDLGVTRSLSRSLEIPLLPRTSAYGDAFEHFVILEFWRAVSYFYPDYELGYVSTKDGAEIDLVLDRPAQPPVLIEIKSSDRVEESDVNTLKTMSADIPGSEAYCLSRDPSAKQWGRVTALPWHKGLKTIVPNRDNHSNRSRGSSA